MPIEKSNNPDAFVAFENAGWDANIAGYDDAFGPVSRQTVEPTLDAANVESGMRVLDVCTGPGMLVERALKRGAQAVGVDFSDQVIELARKNVPDGEFHQGDAQSLPFTDNEFDAVVCGYGVMHVPEPELAMREMLRVVRPAGRVSISVWDSSTPKNAFGLIYAAVGAHGSFDVQLPHGPDFFQFATEDKMRAALSDVGLSEIDALLFQQFWHIDGASQFLEAMRKGTVRARSLLIAQTEDALKDIQDFLEENISPMKNETGGFDLPLPAIIGSGVKSA